MWFWINFSPIGQAPPSPKKPDLPDDKKKGAAPEPALEGLGFCFQLIKNKVEFRRKTISCTSWGSRHSRRSMFLIDNNSLGLILVCLNLFRIVVFNEQDEVFVVYFLKQKNLHRQKIHLMKNQWVL
jgi:hypothetical protein